MKKIACCFLSLLCLSLTSQLCAQISDGFDIFRGDANNNGFVETSDATFINSYLFSGGPAPPCMDQADANDDGQVDISDSIYLLNYLQQGGPAPPAPFPNCGKDPTSDSLGCNDSWCSN